MKIKPSRKIPNLQLLPNKGTHISMCAISKEKPLFTCGLQFLALGAIWASSRENLSLGFPSKRVSKRSPQLQRLARKLKFHLRGTYRKMNNKGADHTAWYSHFAEATLLHVFRRLCWFRTPKTGFLASRPIFICSPDPLIFNIFGRLDNYLISIK